MLRSRRRSMCSAVEYLPGQFDQRADSCGPVHPDPLPVESGPLVRTAKVYAVLRRRAGRGPFPDLKKYVINPVEAREAVLGKARNAGAGSIRPPLRWKPWTASLDLDRSGSGRVLLKSTAWPWTRTTLAFCQNYFRNEGRESHPYGSSRMLDTYWSDHCRHTTFLTSYRRRPRFEDAHCAERPMRQYLAARKEVYGERKPPGL